MNKLTDRTRIHVRERSRTNYPRSFRGFMLFMVIAMLLGACRPGGQPPSVSETAAPDGNDQMGESTGSGELALVVDNGAPLPPQVIARQPKAGQELPPDGPVSVVFDHPMDRDATGDAWQFTGPDGRPVTGKVSWPDERTLRFTPEAPLEMSSLYMASLSTEARSEEGVPLQDELTLQFETVGSLLITQVFPADGAREVADDSVITVIFNRPVVPLTIAEQQADRPSPVVFDPPVSGTGEWINTSVYAFRPDPPLQGGVTYTAVVNAGLETAAGDTELAEDYTWSFTTIAPTIAALELSNGTVNPPDRLRNVLLDDFFAISFQQPMDPGSTEAALDLQADNGETVPLVTRWDDSFSRVVITPTQRLDLDTNYTLTLDENAQAAVGGSLREGLDWTFTTVPPPAILSISPSDDTVQSQFTPELAIKFASPMNIESVKERLVLTPEPENLEWWYRDWDWSIATYALQPSTSYELRILPGMQDIYGNVIQEGQSIRFTTAAYEPQVDLQMPYMPALFREGTEQEFYVSYVNADELNLELYRVSSDLFVQLLDGRVSQYEYQPESAELVWESTLQVSGPENERTLESVTMQTLDGNPLPPGLYFLTLDSPQVRHPGAPFASTRLLMVSTANATFKSSWNSGLVWLTDLDSGRPLSGVSVTVYDKDFQDIGKGVSDADGLLELNLPDPQDPYEARYAMTDGEDVFAFAASNWGSGVGMIDFGMWVDFYAPGNQPTAYLYTDRPIYRPGQPVYFKGIVRLDDDLDYRLPSRQEVLVSLSSFEEEVYQTTLPLDEFGTFSGEMLLDQDAALGSYSLSVRWPDSDQVMNSLGFSVAEYRRPEFLVEVSASPADVLAGQTFQAEVSAEFFSGGNVAGAEVGWTLSSQPFSFTPPDEYSGYSFRDDDENQFLYERPQSDYSEIIADGQGQTGDDGRLVLDLPADLSEMDTSRQLTFEATVTDIAGTAVSGRASVVAHRSSVYAGIKPESYVGQAGKPQTFEVVVLDWDGQPVPDQPVSVEIVERRWYSVQEQDASGRITWTSSVEDIPVASFNDLVVDSDGTISVSFTPENGGIYRARVTALDEAGNPSRAAAFLWVAGEDYVPWPQTNDRTFDLVADRKQYAPGDTAELLIASPFEGESYALVTVERGKVRYADVILLTGNSTVYELPVTPDMAPNVYVSVLLIKGVDDANPRPNFKMSMVEIKVDTSVQELSVEVIPDREEVGPGEQVTYAVLTRGSDGQPVRAEVSLSLSDLATLSLMEPNSRPILDYFYSFRTLSVWTSVPIFLNMEDFNATVEETMAEGQGMGSGGGGKGEGEFGVVEVRQDFPDTALWAPNVVTDENGQATVSVTLPDNLTTWRMDARAVTLDTKVGQTTTDIMATKPLLVRPQTPRFFVSGDRVQLGAAVHNNTDSSLAVVVTLNADGLQLESDPSQELEIAAGRQAFVSWDAVVQPLGSDGAPLSRVDLVMSVEGTSPDGETYSDASRPTLNALEGQGLPVYRYQARETVGTSGQLLEGGSVVEAISLPTLADPSFEYGAGTLIVELAPSLAAGMTDGLTYLENYEYTCIEQTISSFLPNVVSTRALQDAGLSDPELETNLATEVNTSLQRLYNQQNSDGGWGWWRGKSDAQTSAYVVIGLVEAQRAGYEVNSDVLDRGLGYLRTQVRAVRFLEEPWRLNRQSFVLYALAQAGQPDVSSAVQLYDQRQNMALYARAFLAQTLWLVDSEDPRLETLLSDFNNAAILSATGAHWEEPGERDYWNWNTDTRTTAILLETLSLLDPENPLNANAVRWLMDHRTDGHWASTQETAWTLMALTNWMEASGELQADYAYAVELNGARLTEGVANRDTLRQTNSLRVDVADLMSDQVNRLAIAREAGPGNLYYTTHLDLALPVERIEALDQGIIVSRSYYRPEDLTTPVTSAQRGDLIQVRLTVVAPHDLHYVVVDDPLPAGLEAVDPNLETSPQNQIPDEYDWQELNERGWGWWQFDHIQRKDEKLVLSADYLPAGTYVYNYLVRAGTAGDFGTIPPTAQEFYFPEVYGRGDGLLFTVTP